MLAAQENGLRRRRQQPPPPQTGPVADSPASAFSPGQRVLLINAGEYGVITRWVEEEAKWGVLFDNGVRMVFEAESLQAADEAPAPGPPQEGEEAPAAVLPPASQ